MNRSQEWITENFETLVSEYGGKYIGVVNERVIAAALTPKEIIEHAKGEGIEEEQVSILKVPIEEELTCIL